MCYSYYYDTIICSYYTYAITDTITGIIAAYCYKALGRRIVNLLAYRGVLNIRAPKIGSNPV